MYFTNDGWQSYELIDAGDKERLENWNGIVLRRPDPSAIWQKSSDTRWNKYHALYNRSNTGGGKWEYAKKFAENWTINYQDLVFKVSLMNFKHTGVFPEQASNWDFIRGLITKADKPIKVLNLFAYTGCATMAASKAGASEVVHVDAAKGMVNWAKDNMVLNHLENNSIRYFVDDVNKFVAREQRRGNKYDIIIMDPPSYGRGPNNELWKLEDEIESLIQNVSTLLTDKPTGFVISTYTTGFSPLALDNLINKYVAPHFDSYTVETNELTLPISDSKMLLPCGITSRCY